MSIDQEDELVRPTPERLAKAGDDIAEFISDGRLTYRMKDSPIDRLAFGKRHKINADQYGAAMRLYADAYGAGLIPSCVIDLAKERVDGGQYKDISDIRIACQVRYEHAIKVLSYDHFMIVEAIVVQEVSLAEYAERFTRHRKRIIRQGVAVELLCQGLDSLARHYNPSGLTQRSIRSSMAEGDRPIILPSEKANV